MAQRPLNVGLVGGVTPRTAAHALVEGEQRPLGQHLVGRPRALQLPSGVQHVLATGPEGLSPPLAWSADGRRFIALQGGNYTRSVTVRASASRLPIMRP